MIRMRIYRVRQAKIVASAQRGSLHRHGMACIIRYPRVVAEMVQIME